MNETVPYETSRAVSQDEFFKRLEEDQRAYADARWRLVTDIVSVAGLPEQKLLESLAEFHTVCDRWIIGAKDAVAILGAVDVEPAQLGILKISERLSSLLEISRLLDIVLRKNDAKINRWLRRGDSHLDGERPIDLIIEGLSGQRQVREYLQRQASL